MTAETADLDVRRLAVEREAPVPKRKRREGDEDLETQMEMEMEVEENFTHTCKICKKKFVSGRAFGGHMRIHGPVATAERLGASIELQKKRCRAPAVRAKDGETRAKSMEAEAEGGFDPGAMYALRRHPKRSWRVSDREFSVTADPPDWFPPPGDSHACEACGKDFSSWKSLIAHMKCHADPLWKTRPDDGAWEYSDEDAADGESDNEIRQQARRGANSGSSFERWMKGKRSKRPRSALQGGGRDYQSCSDNNEDEEMAMCLVMLSGGLTEPRGPAGSKAEGIEPESATKKPKAKRQPASAAGWYECGRCNKVFHSHQALGGHRASHKKLSGCCSSRTDGHESLGEEITDEVHRSRPAPKEVSSEESYGIAAPGVGLGKGRLHECSICRRVFPTGQALGGHKRCHWIATPGGASETTSTVSSTKELLDLNLPPSAHEDLCARLPTTTDSHRPCSDDLEPRSRFFGPPCLPPWWMGGYPRPGLFLYNGHPRPSPDDEVDSRPGARIGLGTAHNSDFRARPQPWLLS